MKLRLTDGSRVIVADDVSSDVSDDPSRSLSAHDRAVDVMRDRFGVERHLANFVGVTEETIDFRVSKDIVLPAGVTWTKRPPEAAIDPKRAIVLCANALGFPLVGVTVPELPRRYIERFDAWLASGAAASMDFLARKADERRHPTRSFKGSKSVVALATPYSPIDRSDPGARIARYAQSRDYHEAIDKRLHTLKRFVERTVGGKCYLSVDTGAVLERAYAEQAGVGWIGKNGVLISRTHGSYLFLATLWTSAVLEPDAPAEEHCGTCTACIGGCPTRAITQPGFVDARRCIAYWTIEHEGAFTERTHGWLFGCDVCQEVCPWNRFAAAPRMKELCEPRTFLGAAPRWIAASDAQIEETIAGTPLRRAGSLGLRRNALKLINDY